jgi:hypothetical protein
MDKGIYRLNIAVLTFMAIVSLKSTFIVNLRSSFGGISEDKGIIYTLIECLEFFDLLIKPIFIVAMVCIFISNIAVNNKHINLFKHCIIGLTIIFYSIYSLIYFDVSNITN